MCFATDFSFGCATDESSSERERAGPNSVQSLLWNHPPLPQRKELKEQSLHCRNDESNIHHQCKKTIVVWYEIILVLFCFFS